MTRNIRHLVLVLGIFGGGCTRPLNQVPNPQGGGDAAVTSSDGATFSDAGAFVAADAAAIIEVVDATVPPSQAAQDFCAALIAAASPCGISIDLATCLVDAAKYSDADLTKAVDCTHHRCGNGRITNCIEQVLPGFSAGLIGPMMGGQDGGTTGPVYCDITISGMHYCADYSGNNLNMAKQNCAQYGGILQDGSCSTMGSVGGCRYNFMGGFTIWYFNNAGAFKQSCMQMGGTWVSPS